MKNVYLFLAEGFEEIEAITIVDVMRRAGIDIKTVAVSKEKQVRGAHDIIVLADETLESCSPEASEMLILPGGMPGTTNLEACEALRRFLISFASQGKYIAAICAAPSVLGKLGLLIDKEATCYPGFEKYLTGAHVSQETVVQADNIITSRGPGTAAAFALKLVALLVGEDEADRLGKGMLIQ